MAGRAEARVVRVRVGGVVSRRRPFTRNSERAPLPDRLIDQAGDSVPGALLTATEVGTGLTRTAVTGDGWRLLDSCLAAGHVSHPCGVERLPDVDS